MSRSPRPHPAPILTAATLLAASSLLPACTPTSPTPTPVLPSPSVPPSVPSSLPHPSRRDPALTARITHRSPLPNARAGSGLVSLGTRLLVVQDDVPAAILVDPKTRATETLILEGDGTARTKALKPDFEAALQGPDGAVYILGSGSTAMRRRIARVDVATRLVTVLDAGALYDALGTALGHTPNIEGAVLAGDRVLLLHRGAGKAEPSAIVPVSAASLRGGASDPGPAQRWDLGEANGVPLTFTDATAMPNALPNAPNASAFVYLAVAEDTPNAIDDGPIAGAAVGIVRGTDARWAPLLEPDGTPSKRKVEGVTLDADGRNGWLVTDPDDANAGADLCRLELSGPW